MLGVKHKSVIFSNAFGKGLYEFRRQFHHLAAGSANQMAVGMLWVAELKARDVCVRGKQIDHTGTMKAVECAVDGGDVQPWQSFLGCHEHLRGGLMAVPVSDGLQDHRSLGRHSEPKPPHLSS
jgi:hypothetical protein